MKRFTIVLLVFLLLLSGCGKQEAGQRQEETRILVEAPSWDEAVEQAGREGETIWITTAVLVEDGVPRVLTREEYVELTTQERVSEESVLTELPLSSPRTLTQKLMGYSYQFTPQKVTVYDAHAFTQYAEQNRIAPLFVGASAVPARFEMTVERFCVDSEEGAPAQTDEVLESVDDQMAATFGYSAPVETSERATAGAKFAVSGIGENATILFIPRMMIVEGTLSQTRYVLGVPKESKPYAVSYRYPVTVDGYCDGIYMVAECDEDFLYMPLY